MLKTDNVTIRFGGLVAVNKVSIHVKKGQITGLIGPNGAGKTTFFNCISGVYKPNEGHVIFDGKDDLTVEEKQLHLLNQVAYRLYQYSGDSRYLYDHDNPILRLKDDDNASVDCLVSTEIITSDMIE